MNYDFTPIVNGAGVLGVVVAFVLGVFWALWRALTIVPEGKRTARLVTGSEAAGYLVRAEEAEKLNRDLVAQNTELMKVTNPILDRLGEAMSP